ncbi:unnamed protein product [Cochlearia groenlandica]
MLVRQKPANMEVEEYDMETDVSSNLRMDGLMVTDVMLFLASLKPLRSKPNGANLRKGKEYRVGTLSYLDSLAWSFV